MSRAIPLIDELLAALGTAMSQEHVDHLLHLGVPAATTIMCGAARIEPDGDLYQPDDNGFEATIVPVIDDEVVTDLLAFALDCPGRWWLRTGVAAYLGGDCLHQLVMDEPLLIFANALGWLRAEAPVNGCVILNWQAAARDIPPVPIIADCVALAEKLDRCLSIAHVPDIHVPRAA